MTTDKINDDLQIPAALVRKPGTKPTPAKPVAPKAPDMTGPNAEQLAAVEAFAAKYGKIKGGWKEHLLTVWMSGADEREPNGHLLRQVRNQCGPTWLKGYKPAKAPAVTKAPAQPKAAKGKALSAKAEAQQRAGVKVTEPTVPAATTPAPKAPADKPVVSAKDTAKLVKAVRAHGEHFAHKNGWDLLIKQTDAEIAAQLDGIASKTAAIKKMRTTAQALDKKRTKDQPAPKKA